MVELNELFKDDDTGLLDAIKKNTDISSAFAFAANTNERLERSNLAQTLNCPKHTLYYYAKLADLLLCTDITLEDAKFLVQTGVRCANDVFYLNVTKYLSYLREFGYQMKEKTVDEALVNRWVSSATEMKSRSFECEETDPQNQSYTYYETQTTVRKASTSMGVDLRDIISELGAGLSDAQKSLDMNSISVQKEILEDPNLRTYGLNATWYTIPETTFSLKMTYLFSEESATSVSEQTIKGGAVSPRPKLRMRIVPSNATYNNTYKTSGEQESTLTLRFVPIPPPEGITERIQMPDLLGSSVDEAIVTLQDLGLEYELVRVKGEPKNGNHTEVLRQSLSSGATITDHSLLDIAPDTYVMARTRITLTYLDDESGKDPTETTLQAVLNEVKQTAATSRAFADAAEISARNAEESAAAAKQSADNAALAAEKAEGFSERAEMDEIDTLDKTYRVQLKSCSNKVSTIKILRQLLDCSLVTAKEYTESMPVMLPNELKKAEALNWKNQLQEIGAVAELVEV